MKWKALLIIFVVLGLTTTGALWVYQGKKAKEKALKEELTRPKIVLNNTDSAISDVYFAYKEGGLSKAREKAEKGNIVKLVDEKVDAELKFKTYDPSVKKDLLDLGVEIKGESADFVDAYIPIDKLEELSKRPYIKRIERPFGPFQPK